MEMLNCKGVRFSLVGIGATRTKKLIKVGSQSQRFYRAMTITCCEYSPDPDPASKRHERYQLQPQNVDLPELHPKNKKKPFPVPIKKMLQASRQNRRLAQMRIEKPLEPPKNGLLLPELVPVAYEVLDNWKVLIRGLSELLNVVTVYGCRKCPQVHVGPVGHEIQDCYGSGSQHRNSHHSWVRGTINDVLIPIESYHLFDPFGRRVKHDTRFDFDRIPAIVELCIQAGVDLPQYPSRRRTAPVRMIGKKVIDRGGRVVEEPKPHRSEDCVSLLAELDTFSNQHGQSPAPSNMKEHAEMTLKAYCNVREGVRKLMRKYSVKACGYCSEVHVGPWGHNVKLCGAFKHQWRDGKHGWQDAVVDEVIPPNYVWHVPDPAGPPLISSLRSFYGKAPAVVELCVQAGAEIPDEYIPMMRTDIVIPDSKEVRRAA
ncbi:APO protein 1, chloroplastic [Lolium perenne]|uniref:APO protein 1, chloroplastic n=1 Tax=Lolium perenne TaxID=4522 RepID=UPI0021F56697|nr:APO protein 1, chloroplastic [Lolium perenne]XP_051218931.1 APO protein 1, chloroplastic [Lolium perenne]XP_051218932.1 APO protein 1, chloroplastic [Lolium perenne]